MVKNDNNATTEEAKMNTAELKSKMAEQKKMIDYSIAQSRSKLQSIKRELETHGHSIDTISNTKEDLLSIERRLHELLENICEA